MMAQQNAMAASAFEDWLDEPANQSEPWPPTRASWGRFCANTRALVGGAEGGGWEAYAAEGFSTVDENGTIHQCAAATATDADVHSDHGREYALKTFGEDAM